MTFCGGNRDDGDLRLHTAKNIMTMIHHRATEVVGYTSPTNVGVDEYHTTLPSLEDYKRLENELLHIRQIHRGEESPEEDEILEKMDAVWSQLSSEEQAVASAEPHHGEPINPLGRTRRIVPKRS